MPPSQQILDSQNHQHQDTASMSPNALESVVEKNPPADVNISGDTEAFAANGETEEVHHLALHDVDKAAAFVSGFHGEIDPNEAHKVLRKIDWNLLPLM